MKEYYRIEQSLDDEYVISRKFQLPLSDDGFICSFKYGRSINASLPNPLVIGLERLEGKNPRHYIEGAGIVIISDRFLKALKKAGVDNFEVFPATLHDMKDGRRWNNYYAFNEIGVLDVALLEKCNYNIICEGTPLTAPDYGFTKLVFSAERLKQDYKMFRILQDSASGPYISEDVLNVFKELSPPEKWGLQFTQIEIQ
jgi:hypothetical protein